MSSSTSRGAAHVGIEAEQRMIGEILFWSGFGILFLSYCGYGLWMAWCARYRPNRVQPHYAPDDALPAVTCVMSARNEASLIGRKIAGVRSQDYPQDRIFIMVVSDGSSDQTDEVVRAWSRRDDRIRLLRLERASGKPAAINHARPHIPTGVAVFMDVRQQLTPRAIRDLVAHLADPTVGVVSGDLRVKGDLYWRYERFVRRCESRSGSMVQTTGSLYAIRTADVPPIPPTTILDDVYIPLSVALTGRRIVMAEEAGSLDVATTTVKSEFVRKVRTLAGLVQICHILSGCLRPGRNPAWGRFILHKLSRLACPYGLVALFAGSLLAPHWGYRLVSAGLVLALLMAAAAPLGVRFRLASITTSFLALNAAAFWAVPAYYFGWASVTWARVEVDRT
jgi:cellulose synthase/poly-beta-1,6-N-acetylglucosamine synthase-like glycosyltransferase